MKKYNGKYEQFIEDIKTERFFIKDQWQFQMHVRALKKVGQQNLYFYTSGILDKELNCLSVNGHAVSKDLLKMQIQQQINDAVKTNKLIAIFPEGPDCSPTE